MSGWYSHQFPSLSGMKSKVDELKAAYDREECPCLEEYDPHTVASLLKQYLRELPENLLGRDLAQRFEDACGRQVEAEKVSEFQRLLAEVPADSRLVLSWVVTHMDHVIAREADTKMNIQNISIVLNPTIQVREDELCWANRIWDSWEKITKEGNGTERVESSSWTATGKLNIK